MLGRHGRRGPTGEVPCLLRLATMSTTSHEVEPAVQHRTLVRLMLLSVAAAVVTIALKAAAAAVTGSVGFLSDAWSPW